MAGQNDFLIFDENKDNMLTQELYQEDADRTDGFQKGVARSNVNNKVLHQTSMMCHAIGELAKDNDLIVSDEGGVDELKSAIGSLFSAPDKVSKSGDTMTGTLIVKNDATAGIQLTAEQLDLTTTPTTAQYAKIQINDVNGQRFGCFEVSQDAKGATYTSINTMYTKSNGSKSYSAVQAVFDANGTAYATAPTYTTYTDNSQKIATTAFLKSVLSGNGYGLATFSKAKKGYYKFDNGLLIQWGEFHGTNSGTITYPKAFTSATSYALIGSLMDNSSNNTSYYRYPYTKTATNFTYNPDSARGGNWVAIGY